MKKEFFVGLMIGLISGATIGILLAPKKGEDTQKDISEAMSRLKIAITEKIDNLEKLSKEKFNEIVDSTFDSINDLRNISSKERENLKNEIKDKYEEVKEVIER